MLLKLNRIVFPKINAYKSQCSPFKHLFLSSMPTKPSLHMQVLIAVLQTASCVHWRFSTQCSFKERWRRQDLEIKKGMDLISKNCYFNKTKKKFTISLADRKLFPSQFKTHFPFFSTEFSEQTQVLLKQYEFKSERAHCWVFSHFLWSLTAAEKKIFN